MAYPKSIQQQRWDRELTASMAQQKPVEEDLGATAGIALVTGAAVGGTAVGAALAKKALHKWQKIKSLQLGKSKKPAVKEEMEPVEEALGSSLSQDERKAYQGHGKTLYARTRQVGKWLAAPLRKHAAESRGRAKMAKEHVPTGILNDVASSAYKMAENDIRKNHSHVKTDTREYDHLMGEKYKEHLPKALEKHRSAHWRNWSNGYDMSGKNKLANRMKPTSQRIDSWKVNEEETKNLISNLLSEGFSEDEVYSILTNQLNNTKITKE